MQINGIYSCMQANFKIVFVALALFVYFSFSEILIENKVLKMYSTKLCVMDTPVSLRYSFCGLMTEFSIGSLNDRLTNATNPFATRREKVNDLKCKQ